MSDEKHSGQGNFEPGRRKLLAGAGAAGLAGVIGLGNSVSPDNIGFPAFQPNAFLDRLPETCEEAGELVRERMRGGS